MTRFGYCFESPPGRSYPPILNARLIEPARSFSMAAMAGGSICIPSCRRMVKSLRLDFALADVAYSPDISGLVGSMQSSVCRGLDVWIVDALRYTRIPAISRSKQALEWIERLKPKRAILTHLHVDLDYDTLRRDLPAHVEPAYDGMQFRLRLRRSALRSGVGRLNSKTRPLSCSRKQRDRRNSSAISSGVGKVMGSSPGNAC